MSLDAKIDFTNVTGKINKMLHGSNTCPPLYPRSINNEDEVFRAMHFSLCRTHDWALWNSGQRVIDTHFVFPLMKLDPDDPTNYYFDATDEIIRLCQDNGGQILYRMGTSIEHTLERHFNTVIPTDYEKYAKVLANIIRHYTQGWANGFHYDIKYWEIWNEADLGNKMWDGPFEEFLKFFVIVLKHLKNEFPNLKIGGPGACGIHCLPELLQACKDAGVAPDFISWHHYGSRPEALIAQPKQIREQLDSYGFTKCETCINEWHYIITWDGVHAARGYAPMGRNSQDDVTGICKIDSAVFNLAVLAGFQETPLDTACFYGAGWKGSWGFRDQYDNLNKVFYSMKIFGEFVTDYTDKVASRAERTGLYTLAAFSPDHRKASVLVADYRCSLPTIDLEINGMDKATYVSAIVLDDKHDSTPVPVIWHDGKLTLTRTCEGSAAFAVTFEC